MSDGLEPYTLYNHLIILKTWLKWCRRGGMIKASPLDDFVIAKLSRRRHPAATLEQVDAVLKVVRGEWLAVFATLAFTGLRVGEAVGSAPATWTSSQVCCGSAATANGPRKPRPPRATSRFIPGCCHF